MFDHRFGSHAPRRLQVRNLQTLQTAVKCRAELRDPFAKPERMALKRCCMNTRSIASLRLLLHPDLCVHTQHILRRASPSVQLFACPAQPQMRREQLALLHLPARSVPTPSERQRTAPTRAALAAPGTLLRMPCALRRAAQHAPPAALAQSLCTGAAARRLALHHPHCPASCR